jgi:glycosyltransferase involved in cell wall biosynthesis
MPRKRILLIDLGNVLGGVEYHVEDLAGFLQGSADLYCLCILPEFAKRLEPKGVRVFLLPKMNKLLNFAAAFCLLPWLILRNRIDLVQLNGLMEGLLVLPIRLLGREVTYTRHGPFEHDLYKWYRNPAKAFPRLISRTCAKLATQIVCVSHTLAGQVSEIVSPEKVKVVPNWVRVIPPYRPRPRHSGAIRLLFVGRLERYKGLYLLLEAMRLIPETSLRVICDGSYRPELERMAQGLDVIFEGFQPDPGRFYDEADIFVMPSLGPEGLPIVTLDAMARGVPCIISDIDVNCEMSDQGRGALLFASGNAADLTQKLRAMIEQPGLRESYSREGYAIVCARYSREGAARAYLAAFGLKSETQPAEAVAR